MHEVDRATLEIERRIRSLLSLRKRPATILATGYCLNCEEVFSEQEQQQNRRWCDADCRDDWEKRNRT